MKPYYYALRVKPDDNEIKHDTLAQAQADAEQLAAKFLGHSYEILKCVGVASCSKASTFWMDGEEPKEDPPAIQFFRNSAWDVFWMVNGETAMIFRDWVGEWQQSETPSKYFMARLQPIDESSLPEEARQKLKEIEQ